MSTQLLYDFVTLLAVVNPIEAAATFATLTARNTASEQATIALRACTVALVILLAFGFIGGALLAALGIGFPAFRIAGGLLLFVVGFNMVFAKETGTRELAPDEEAHAKQTEDPSVFPLAIPIITGPGALTTIVALVSKRREPASEILFVVFIGIAVLAITYVSMRGSQWVTRVLGATGVNAIGRVMGIIVAAIAIQLIVDGFVQVFPVLKS
ncbi:MAG: NAAT family transporter [Candidatus Eremiobacteraeota bacterium]|nr:NAAT family transporter [Candidatus Eremiobacteraeota bacterium]MBV9648496.1 NAAT family transporter [Candidatus Eremiobacteraeota bacterium]